MRKLFFLVAIMNFFIAMPQVEVRQQSNNSYGISRKVVRINKKIAFLSLMDTIKTVGVNMHFGDSSELLYVNYDSMENHDFVNEAKEKGFQGKCYQSYVIMFDGKGHLVREGWVIYKDDIEYDGEEVGKWIQH